jgi:peptidoglycan/LPS O-acetylase OafA/YrhL
MLIAAALIAGIFVIIAALLFIGIYFALPEHNHFDALLWIGSLSLVFCVGAYFSQAVSRDALVQRSLAWGFLGLGFAVLFLTVGLAPNSEWSPMARLDGLIVLFLLLAGAAGAVAWRLRGMNEEEQRARARREWSRRPTLSAFNYAFPGTPAPPVPEAAGSPPASPPGANS